jgi:hypothetical protein
LIDLEIPAASNFEYMYINFANSCTHHTFFQDVAGSRRRLETKARVLTRALPLDTINRLDLT